MICPRLRYLGPSFVQTFIGQSIVGAIVNVEGNDHPMTDLLFKQNCSSLSERGKQLLSDVRCPLAQNPF